MAYDATDIKHYITLCEENVRHLDTLAEWVRTIEDGTFDYASLIPDELYRGKDAEGRSGTEVPLIVKRPGLRPDADVIQSVVGWPARITVDLPKAGPENERKEDEFEAFFAYSSHMCDPRGDLKSLIHSHQVLSSYSGIWQSVVPYDPPKKRRDETTADYDYRLKAYDKKYWRWHWDVPSPYTVSFTDIQGDVNLACIYEEFGAIDFMERFGEYEDEDDLTPLKMYSEQFSWLRASDGTSPERGNEEEWFRGNKTIKLWRVDNGSEICCFVEGGGGTTYTSGKRTHGTYLNGGGNKLKSSPNTFGRPSFVLVHGTYRPGSNNRYAPLLYDLAQAYFNVTVMQSLYYTMQANDRWLTALPETVAQSLVNAQIAEPNAKLIDQYMTSMGPGVTPTLGTPVHATNLPQNWSDNIERMEAQLAQARSVITVLTPDSVTQRNAPTSNVLAAQQQGLRPWEKPTTSWTTGYERLFDMQAHDVVYGLNPHLANVGPSKDNNVNYRGSKDDHFIEFLAGDYTGKAAYQPASRVPKGKGYKLTPERFKEFLDDGSIKVEHIADTDATRMARAQFKMGQLNNIPPLATPKDVWEAEGILDTSAKATELNIYMRMGVATPKIENLDWTLFLETIAAREGRSVPEMAALLGGPPQQAGNGDNISAPPGMNLQSVAPPAGPTPSEGGLM